MAYLKRQAMPKTWPMPRKGTAYVVKPLAELSSTIPLLVVMRDLLKIAQNRRETKRALHLKQILLNNKAIRDAKTALHLFDVLSILPLKKNYRIELSKDGKFKAIEVKESESRHKVAKIIDKKTLKGKKTQLNLSDGRNYLSDIECNVNDSVLVNVKESKIEKCLPLREGAKMLIIAGKHIGDAGKINTMDKDKKMVKVEKDDGTMVNVLIKQLIVTE